MIIIIFIIFNFTTLNFIIFRAIVNTFFAVSKSHPQK